MQGGGKRMMKVNVDMLKGRIYGAGYKYAEFASVAGVSIQTISNVVNGHTRPSYQFMAKVVEVLELSGDDIKAIFFSK